MKTRKTLIVILVMVLLVVYYVIGTDYLKQRREQAALASQLTETIAALAQIPEPPADLEQRLSAAEARRAAAKDSLPGMMSSTYIVNTVLRLAEASQVKAIPLITQPWQIEELGEYGYAVFRLNVAAEGNFNQVIDFLQRLESGEMPTLVVTDLNVTAEAEPALKRIIGITPVSASLDLAIYTRPPAYEPP